MFIGTSHNSIDSKNRLVIPSKYRDELGGRCVLARGFDTCLYLYTMAEYEAFAAKCMQYSMTDKEIRRFIRVYFSSAEECKIDGQNRILIPKHLKEFAHINKDIVLLGSVNKIEVWGEEVLSDPENENMMDDAEVVKKLSSIF